MSNSNSNSNTTPTPSPKGGLGRQFNSGAPPTTPQHHHHNNNNNNNNNSYNASSTTHHHHHSHHTDYTNLPPPLMHTLRTSFHFLDKDSDGLITPTDLLTTLTSLSLPATTTHTQPFFTSAPHPVNLASYLTHFSSFLGEISSEEELVMAFEAFDDEDDGTVGLDELKDALMNTGEKGERLDEAEVERAVRGFTKKRGLRGGKGMGMGMGGGERFGYRDWVGLVCGKAGEGED
ncbi:hypothetical protein DFH27DRAFT_634264 [Peziza echinospora]|nr:hypothetical protein DFH27DRAFT_634264 [Peziza echinospora]